jgi:hypothetical protein
MRRAGLAAAALLGAAACAPAPAVAHGLGGRADLPVPDWLFSWAAGAVLVVSFLAMATLWKTPRLEDVRSRALVALPRAVEVLAGAIGVALFALVVVSGLAGTDEPLDNLAPTAIFVAFWVGLPLASALLGDLFRPLNPWRAIARAAAWAVARARGRPLRAPRGYPARLGRWPAAAGIVAFGWVELAYAGRDVPARLAGLALAYAAVQLAGMALFGIERWTARADAFAVAFGMIGRIGVLAVREGRLVVRRPLAGLAGLDPTPGTAAVACALIGVTTFDGASNGELWAEAGPRLGDAIGRTTADTLGLLVAVGAVAGLYALGVAGMRGAVRRPPDRLAERFAQGLVPIGVAYALAHYFSLVVFQGQALGPLLADPLGRGGGAPAIDYAAVGAETIWYVQVAALIAGHLAGLVVAHDRALVLFRRPGEAVRSQYWMLAVMVGYTGLGLWLLSAVTT